jgi:hypothetical protein
VEIRRFMFNASPGKKFTRPHLNQGPGVVSHACQPSYVGSTNREIVVQASLGINKDPISKITNTKRAGGMVQMVECLPSKVGFNLQYCQEINVLTL